MPITALALLRIAQPETPHRVDVLSDGVLVHTTSAFSSDPEELTMALATALGEAVFAHDDPRGIFFVPSVAAPKATSYDALIAEVGEGGVWGPSPIQIAESVQQTDFGALLGSMLSQLPPSLMSSAQAALGGDSDALGAMTSQLQAMLGSSPALAGLAEQVGELMAQQPQNKPAGEELAALDQLMAGFGASEADQSSLREMVLNMQHDLMSDPSKLEQLTRQMLAEKKP